MPPQGFFGDPTSALLPATARSGANGNWFFGYKGKSLASQQPEVYLSNRRASMLRAQRLALANAAKKAKKAKFGTISDSLSGVVKPGPPNMRTFPMLGAYPGEVGPGNTPGGTANNGSFPGTENSLMSYFFTYGRRRSVRKKARRSARKKARRSVRRSMRRC